MRAQQDDAHASRPLLSDHHGSNSASGLEAEEKSRADTHMASHYLGEPHGIEMQEIIELDHLAFFAEGTKAEVYRVQGHRGALAVKILKQSSEDYEIDRRDFERETDVLRRLVHRNIVNVYAYGSFPRPFAIIEFLDEGTLTQARKHAAKRVGTADLIRRRVFTYVDVLKAALDVASALDYIHERLPNDMLVIHRDLKPDNVGFDGDGTAKLFDFGLCACIKKRKLQSEVYTLTGCTGSMRYMAPEVAISSPYNERVDIYSFGVILWEMASLVTAFERFTKDLFITEVLAKGNRLPIPVDWPAEFSYLITHCWAHEWQDRPSAAFVVTHLRALLQDALATNQVQTPAMCCPLF